MNLHRVKDLSTLLLAVASLAVGILALALPAPVQADPLNPAETTFHLFRPHGNKLHQPVKSIKPNGLPGTAAAIPTTITTRMSSMPSTRA